MSYLMATVMVAVPVAPAQAGAIQIAALLAQEGPAQATQTAAAPPVPANPPAPANPVGPANPVVPANPQAAGQPPAESSATPPQTEHVIVVEGSAKPPKEDPLASINAQTYEVTQQVDQALVAPIAKGYRDGLPGPIRKGMRNFFANLREPVVFLNFLLQGKPGKAMETLGRFTLNSTLGVAGLFDVAKKDPINLPRRNNGFGNTLGFYGVKPGPYLVLPLIGSTSLRDLFGSFVDASTLPTIVGAPFNSPYYGIPAYAVRSLDYRIDMDEKLQEFRDSDDPYKSAREYYLQARQAEIDALHGRATPAKPTAPVTTAPVEPPAPHAVETLAPPPPAEPQWSTVPVPADPMQDMAWQSAQQSFLSGLKATDGWQFLPGGLRWRRVAGDGSGPHPTVADTVTVHYAGNFIDGTSFDSSWDRGEPATFPLARLIPAWQAAIPQMGVGDTIEIAAPATLAYGPQGKGPIPGGATLMFKVQLLGIGAN